MIDLNRFRLLLVAVMMCVVATAAGNIFDERVWSFLLVPVIVTAGAWIVFGRNWAGRLGTGLATIVAGSSYVVFVSGGTISDLFASFGAGAQRVLSTEWPSPDRPDLLGTIAVMLGIATLAAAELTRRERFHLSPLLPILLAQVIVIGLSAPNGAALWAVLSLGVLAMCFALTRPGHADEVTGRLSLLRGERRLFLIAGLAIGAAAAATVPLALSGRADPRNPEPPAASAAVIDPIEATLALQAIDPAIELHTIDFIDDDPTPVRWRTAALDTYDGRRWSPDLTLRPIGRRLAPASPDDISYTVTFENDDLRFVPLPGSPVVIDAPIETDEARTLVGLIDRPLPGTPYSVFSQVDPNPGEAVGAIGFTEVDESTTALTELATTLAAEGGADDSTDILAQLQAIESTMRDDFVLRNDASGGGMQRALIERFLNDTRRGNAEQFATAYVLLARSLGVDARVATGYIIDSDRLPADDSNSLTILSSEAAIWPEVRIGDRWVAFDPVPERESSDAVPPPPEPQIQTPAAPQPPIDPPPDGSDEPVITEEIDDTNPATGLPIVVTYALYVVGGFLLLLVPILLFIGIVLGIKWRRRRRRLSGTAGDRIRGAWAQATSVMVDGGMSIAASNTNDEIADDAADYAPQAHHEVHRLATLASATTFGDPAHPESLATDATACLEFVESSMVEARSLWQRIRLRLSLRSLRRRTASPV